MPIGVYQRKELPICTRCEKRCCIPRDGQTICAYCGDLEGRATPGTHRGPSIAGRTNAARATANERVDALMRRHDANESSGLGDSEKRLFDPPPPEERYIRRLSVDEYHLAQRRRA